MQILQVSASGLVRDTVSALMLGDRRDRAWVTDKSLEERDLAVIEPDCAELAAELFQFSRLASEVAVKIDDRPFNDFRLFKKEMGEIALVLFGVKEAARVARGCLEK